MANDKCEEELKKNILRCLRRSAQPLSTQDLSLKLKKSWHSVHTRCLMLQIESRVTGFRIGRMNLWQAVVKR